MNNCKSNAQKLELVRKYNDFENNEMTLDEMASAQQIKFEME